MKYFFPALMALAILAGITLTVTPYVADWFFPMPTSNLRKAEPQQVAQALAQWFNARPEQFRAPQGIHQVTAEDNTAWFGFQVSREPVETFIRTHRLQQQALTPELLQQVFTSQQPPAEWWQPQALQRETYFSGEVDGRAVALIYHAEQQQGFLIVRTRHSKPSGTFSVH